MPALPQSIGAAGENEAAQAAPSDPNRSQLGLAHLRSERSHGRERRVRVRRMAEVPQFALAVRDRRQQRAALADALHCRYGDVADQGSCGLDPRHCSPSTGATTTP